MANRTRFITIDTRQYTEAEGEIASNRARQQREEDLNAYGAQGYAESAPPGSNGGALSRSRQCPPRRLHCEHHIHYLTPRRTP